MSETIDKQKLVNWLVDYKAEQNLPTAKRVTMEIISKIDSNSFDGITEKQKIIDEQRQVISTANVWNNKIKEKNDSLITTIESQNSQIESLKAITELAVKGLQNVNLIYTGWNSDTASKDMYLSALQTIKTIERLQNGTS